MIFRSLDVQHPKDRRIQIRRLNSRVIARAGFGDTRPDDHGRNANAAFVDATLAATQRVIAGDGRDVFLARRGGLFEAAVDVATVVRVEDDNRFIRDAFWASRAFKQASDSVVQ